MESSIKITTTGTCHPAGGGDNAVRAGHQWPAPKSHDGPIWAHANCTVQFVNDEGHNGPKIPGCTANQRPVSVYGQTALGSCLSRWRSTTDKRHDSDASRQSRAH
ncbi:hypothetical protein DAPPUDRAFT_251861 [Daphnia pulex]|uniref:Uncharacterized protein n=1 Tax=Daphnia pulex TaxID=6669 RepID=E9H1I7_DAPPU|nr:hypothetical protein DAPPUDRAFT_251861 [Daphnia pulex]|eukprot:EFX74363.1 hypothetical protein DAPPUDRAFT_251861 [Daphnia pulex]